VVTAEHDVAQGACPDQHPELVEQEEEECHQERGRYQHAQRQLCVEVLGHLPGDLRVDEQDGDAGSEPAPDDGQDDGAVKSCLDPEYGQEGRSFQGFSQSRPRQEGFGAVDQRPHRHEVYGAGDAAHHRARQPRLERHGAKDCAEYRAHTRDDGEGVQEIPCPRIHTGAFYSITWSARKRMDWGILRPRALAVLRFTISSNRVGCATGRSAGLAPFRILSTYTAAARTRSFVFDA